MMLSILPHTLSRCWNYVNLNETRISICFSSEYSVSIVLVKLLVHLRRSICNLNNGQGAHCSCVDVTKNLTWKLTDQSSPWRSAFISELSFSARTWDSLYSFLHHEVFQEATSYTNTPKFGFLVCRDAEQQIVLCTLLCRTVDLLPIWAQDWVSGMGNYMSIVKSEGTGQRDTDHWQVTTTYQLWEQIISGKQDTFSWQRIPLPHPNLLLCLTLSLSISALITHARTRTHIYTHIHARMHAQRARDKCQHVQKARP